MSNRLQMSLQRQHTVVSYLKTPSFGLPGFKPATSRSLVQQMGVGSHLSSPGGGLSVFLTRFSEQTHAPKACFKRRAKLARP